MQKLSFLLLIVILLTACQKDYNKANKPYHYLPVNTETIIKVNARNDFVTSIENHTIFSSINNKVLKRIIPILKHLNTDDTVYIGVLSNNTYVILTTYNPQLFLADEIPNYSLEQVLDSNLYQTQLDTATVFHQVIGNTFVLSSSIDTVKNLKKQPNNPSEFINLLATTDAKSVASLIFKHNNAHYSKLLFETKSPRKTPSSYAVLDIKSSANSLSYSGIIKSEDTLQNYIDAFKHTIPQKISAINFIPENTTTLFSITYDNFAQLNKNLNRLNLQTEDSTQTFLNFTNEIAQIDDALVIHALDPDLVLETLTNKINYETFRDIDIYQFEIPDFFNTRLQPLITFSNANYFAVYNNFIVFSNATDQLKRLLTSALNNVTLGKSEAFINLSKNLSDEASIFSFKNSEGLSEILEKPVSNYNANAVQFSYEDTYAHVNGVMQKFKKRAASNTITQAFTTTIDAQIINTPQTLKNHITKAHDIAVQDVNNTLYLISSSGNILWQKQLQNKILGKIHQIDSYKNGRLQLAFATSNRLYVLDRNGNDVSNFPLKFKDEITQPLSVFDYDKQKNYRLLITQGKNLLLYNAKGKSVRGFNYKNDNAVITSQPQHFRVSRKDYIVFKTDQKLKILNRQGQNRIIINDRINFSDNAVYLYQNKFTTTNTLGQLIQIDTKGKLTSKTLNLPNKHTIETTSKTLVSLTENKLQIKSRTVDLDYGEYTPPKIYYFNDKIYVTTTDLQSKKVYLFDSQAEPIPNFPVFGTSAAELQKLDKEKGLELICQSDTKTIVVYKLN